MSHYARGAAFERHVQDKLQVAGWICVRAAGSREIIDLLAANGHLVLAIQCKTSGRLDAVDWNALVARASLSPHEDRIVPILAWRPKRGVVQLDRLLGPKTTGRGVRGEREPFLLL